MNHKIHLVSIDKTDNFFKFYCLKQLLKVKFYNYEKFRLQKCKIYVIIKISVFLGDEIIDRIL